MRAFPLLLLAGCQLLGDAVAPTTSDDSSADTDPTLDSGDDDPGDSGGDDSGDEAEEAELEEGAITFVSAWSATGLDLSITGGTKSFLLGMSEEVASGWYGEDGLDGAVGGASGDYDINHDAVGSTGITLLTVHTPAEVEANRTTLLTDTIHEAGHLAYMLRSQTTGRCWEQNDDAVLDHYDCE